MFKGNKDKDPDSKFSSKLADTSEKDDNFGDLFDKKWEAFVIKKDKLTGNLVGKLACCAGSPV